MADPNNPDNLTVIHTPDGATYSFPNTMSQGDITQALSSHLAQKSAAAAASNPSTTLSIPEAGPLDPIVDPGSNAKVRQELYGNDPGGAATAFAAGAGDVPVIGEPLKYGAQSAVAGGLSAASGSPYADELKAVKQYTDAAEAAHPRYKTAGSVTANTAALGGLALVAPEALGMDADALATTNMARAATTGGILQGTQSAEDNGIGQPGKIATDALIGAATMGATPVVGGTTAALVGKLLNKAQPITGQLSGMDQRALEWAVTNLKNDGMLTDSDIDNQFTKLGPHAFLAEYGPNSMGSAQALASLPGPGKTIVQNAFDARQGGQRGRIDQAITDTMGPRINLNSLTAQDQADRSQAAGQLYDQFRNTTVFPTQGVKDLIGGSGTGAQRIPGLEELGLLGDANQMAKLEAAATGQPNPPMDNFFTTGDRKSWPTTQSFDYIKQAIDKRIDGSYNDFGQPTNVTRLYTIMKKRLDDTVANANPDAASVWKQARQAWADPTSIMRARQAGLDAFNPSTRRDDLLQQLTDYTQPERAAHQQGARDALGEMLDGTLNGDTTIRNKLLAPTNQDKLNYLATNKNVNSQDLIDQLQQEKTMGDNKNAIRGNSLTAERQAAQQMMTPDPSQTWAGWAQTAYSPHVMPGRFVIPQWLVDSSAAKQAASYGKSGAALAPIITKQGGDAANFAKALLDYDANKPSNTLAPAIGNMTQTLAAGATPAVINPYVAQKRIPYLQ